MTTKRTSVCLALFCVRRRPATSTCFIRGLFFPLEGAASGGFSSGAVLRAAVVGCFSKYWSAKKAAAPMPTNANAEIIVMSQVGKVVRAGVGRSGGRLVAGTVG